MTLPFERLNSIYSAREFLINLLNPKKRPRIPRSVRREAYYILKHFPASFEIESLTKCKNCSKIFVDFK